MQQVTTQRSRLLQQMQQCCNTWCCFQMLDEFGLVLIVKICWTVSCFWSVEPVAKVIRVSHLLPLLDIQVPNHSLVKTLMKKFENFAQQVHQLQQIKERFIVTYKSCCLWNEAAEFSRFPSWRLYLLNLCNMFVGFSL